MDHKGGADVGITGMAAALGADFLSFSFPPSSGLGGGGGIEPSSKAAPVSLASSGGAESRPVFV
jgi:hypothetical protein